jgi:hypothetical protein
LPLLIWRTATGSAPAIALDHRRVYAVVADPRRHSVALRNADATAMRDRMKSQRSKTAAVPSEP